MTARKKAETPNKVLEEPQSKAVLVPPADIDSIVVTMRPFNLGTPLVQDADLSKVPKFSTKQLAEIFFQRSVAWIRWVNARGLLHQDSTGRVVTPERIVDDLNGMKRYSLADIENVARILYQNGIISVTRLQVSLQIIYLVAVGYGVITVE